MNNIALNSKSKVSASPLQTGAVLRELIAATPVMIFINAMRAALARPAAARGSLRTSGCN